jgi:hypothetical protein
MLCLRARRGPESLQGKLAYVRMKYGFQSVYLWSSSASLSKLSELVWPRPNMYLLSLELAFIWLDG